MALPPSHSRKRRKHEREYWRWQCSPCSGTGQAGHAQRVAGSGRLEAKLRKLLRICRRELRRRCKTRRCRSANIVPDGVDEKDRKSSRASAASSSGGSETRLRPGETNTGNESCGSSRQDAHDSAAESEWKQRWRWNRRTSRWKSRRRRPGQRKDLRQTSRCFWNW